MIAPEFDLAALADRCAETSGQVRADSKLGESARNSGVLRTSEFHRIETLPRRVWEEQEAQDLANQLTAALRQPRGEQVLRPVQAIALLEMYNQQGLFGVIRVGGGKTLITLLAAAVMGAKRPMLLMPAKLIRKTEREMLQLLKHWKIPTIIRIESIEKLGRKQHALMLDQYRPDLIIVDEVHKLKNKDAACTKRVKRYQKAHPTRMIALSGTVTKRSIRDYAHIVRWCLPNACPLPEKFHELEQWSNALDEKCNPVNRVKPGSLLDLATEEERATLDPIVAARRGYARRLMETPGVVKTQDNRLGCSLTIESHFLDQPNNAEAEANFERLRRDWEMPDGHPLADAMTVWRHSREMALGFYYRWNPRPPMAWLEPRKAWAAECRQIVQNNRRGLDSEAQVVQLIKDDPHTYFEAAKLYAEWKIVEPIFTPNTEAVWFDDAVLQWAARWAARHRGIVWVDHTAFGRMLSQITGMPFYHRDGLNADGRMIEEEAGNKSVIASIGSNAEGRNLQQFGESLLVSPPPNGSIWEQLLGRYHRDGQQRDEVTCDVLFNSLEQCTAFHQAVRDAHFMQDSTQQEYKLCYADKNVTPIDGIPNGWRWQK